MRVRILLAIFFVTALTSPGFAQFGPFPAWGVDASFPLQYGTNSLLAPVDVRPDFFTSPSLKVSANGDLDSTTSISFYGLVAPDKFARVREADDGQLTVGGTLQKASGAFGFGATYEHTGIYDGVFRTLLFQANDFSAFGGYSYKNGPLSIGPSLMVTYREADLASAERILLTGKVAVTYKLTQSLLFFVTPRLRYYDFTSGVTAGRLDTRASVIGGLTYQINPDVGLTGSIEYDQRWSNVIGNNFKNTVFLVSLDFSHLYARAPK